MAVARIPSADTYGVSEMARSQRAKFKDLEVVMVLGSCTYVFVKVIVGAAGLKSEKRFSLDGKVWDVYSHLVSTPFASSLPFSIPAPFHGIEFDFALRTYSRC